MNHADGFIRFITEKFGLTELTPELTQYLLYDIKH